MIATWIRLLVWAGIAGGSVFLVQHETSLRLAYVWSASGGMAFFIALVQALRLGRTESAT